MKRILKNNLIIMVFGLFVLFAAIEFIGNIHKKSEPATTNYINTSYNSVNIKKENGLTTTSVISMSNCKSTDKSIIDLTKSFYSAIKHRSSKELGNISDNNGIELIRTFLSGNGIRGQEISENIMPSKIPPDLTFRFVPGEYAIELQTEFNINEKDLSNLKVHSSSEDLNWDCLFKPDILRVFSKLMEKYGEQTSIYKLKDGFCVAQYSGSGLQYSHWAVFQKKDEDYF